jgi:hypothetical protein
MLESPRLPNAGQVHEWVERFRSHAEVLATSLRAPADLLLHPILVLPLIVVAADAPLSAAGTVAAATTLAWGLPQVIVVRADHRPWLLGGRAATALALAILAALAGGAGQVGPLLVLVTVYWALGGLLEAGELDGALGQAASASPRAQLVLLIGGGLAVLVGLWGGGVLGSAGAALPGWLAVFALVAAALLAVAAAMTWRDRSASMSGAPPWSAAPLAVALLAHARRPRRYAGFRVVLALAALADPFLIATGLRAFDASLPVIGLVLALFALIQLVAGFALPPLVAAGHARVVAQLTALGRVILPVLVLSLPVLLAAPPLIARLPPNGGWVTPAAWLGLAVLFCLIVAATTAIDSAYLSEAMAPGHRVAMRTLLVGIVALGSLAYLVGGSVVDRWGLDRLWLAAAVLGLVALLASGMLLDVPPEETRELTDTGALPTFREHHESM